ncbi:MAG TPA: hypothetical protein VM262_12795 [Acidimicrobiales bacterium]|nr:hypothetical protein [Acidimicrobiales bacterium]
MLSSLALGACALAPGLPVALVVGRPRRWSSAVAEGLVLGITWWVLLGLWFSHAGWYAPWQVALPTIALAAALAVPAWRAAAEVDRPRLTWFAGVMAALLAIAAAVRTEPFYFIYQIGDFGEYVNRANAVADGGGFIGWFTQGFTIALSLTHLLLGEARTVDLMPFLGLVLLVVTVEVAARLGASAWARAVVAVILAVGVVPVWFSRFPASETLYAVLQVGMILLVVVAVQRGRTPPAIAAGIVAGLLLVVRGNGILLGPVIVLAVLVSALVVRRRSLEVLTTFLAAALVALGAGFIFNARFSHQYFIAEQLPKFVPDPVLRHLEGMGGLRFALPRVVALVVATAALVAALRWLHSRVGPPRDTPTLRAVRAATLPILVVAVVVALLTTFEHAGVTDALARYNPAVEMLGALGAGVALWRFAHRMDDHERVAITFVVLLAGAFALLYAERLPTPRYAPYFLYWDRYLFSELFPLMVLATIWAVSLVDRARVPRPALGAAVIALGLLLHSEGAVIREHTFMDGAYEQLAAVDALAADPDVPIIFFGVAPETMPPALYHPNTHRIVASPLASTFNRRFLNLGLHPYAPDPLPGSVEPAAILDHRGLTEAYVIQVAVGDDAPAPLDAPYATLVPLGTVTIDIPMLDRPLDRSQPRWRIPRFTVLVSSVTRG